MPATSGSRPTKFNITVGKAHHPAEAFSCDAKKLPSPHQKNHQMAHCATRENPPEQMLSNGERRMRLNRDHERGKRLASTRTHAH